MSDSDTEQRPYTDDEVHAKLAEQGLDRWSLEDGHIAREFSADGWPATLMAANAVAYLCEVAWHHADLSVAWGRLGVRLRTHSSDGITDKDFEMARKIEDVVLWRPAEGSSLDGNPERFVYSKDTG